MSQKFKVERGPDGWNRVVVGMHNIPFNDEFPSFMLMRLAKEATGADWEWFGAFMDYGCLATKEEVGDEITLDLSDGS